jgi:hypothetical protein
MKRYSIPTIATAPAATNVIRPPKPVLTRLTRKWRTQGATSHDDSVGIARKFFEHHNNSKGSRRHNNGQQSPQHDDSGDWR